MIRFFDKKVHYVSESMIDRQEIVSYFENGHKHEIICVRKETGEFIGTITYLSLLEKNWSDVINKNYIISDRYIWENARNYFSKNQEEFSRRELLSVLDKEHNLICFAWQSDEENRELRMLDELMELKCAVTFQDVYPEYDCVDVCDCNELAYFFVMYLKSVHMPVCVSGKIWDKLHICEELCMNPLKLCFCFDGEEIRK